MCYMGVTEENIEKDNKMSLSVFIFIYTIHLAYLKVYTKFENTGSNRNSDLRQKFSLERKKNEQIKGLICNVWLFFVTQYNSSLSSFVTNFRILSQAVAENSLTKKNVHMYFIGVTEGKIKKLKKKTKRGLASQFSFTQYT